MTKIYIMFNGADVTYYVNEPAKKINKKLNDIEMGYYDFLTFENALDKYEERIIHTLVITPSKCSVIELEEVKE